MSVEEIKEQLATLPRKEQDEVVAYLFHLRHRDDAAYESALTARIEDGDPSHWLSPDEFESELDEKGN